LVSAISEVCYYAICLLQITLSNENLVSYNQIHACAISLKEVPGFLSFLIGRVVLSQTVGIIDFEEPLSLLSRWFDVDRVNLLQSKGLTEQPFSEVLCFVFVKCLLVWIVLRSYAFC
tara:strand:- start:1127 stop:1477 length:351 start_codon:yes stop_codon:yes gene_type:complete